MYARIRIACSISMLFALDMLGSPGGKVILANDSQSAVSLRCSAALTPSLRISAGAQAVNKLAAATAMKTGFITFPSSITFSWRQSTRVSLWPRVIDHLTNWMQYSNSIALSLCGV
jgi:hypothetical protein